MQHLAQKVVSLAVLGFVAWAPAGCGHSSSNAGIAPDPMFLALDTDGDGRLSLEESQLPLALFQKLDLNGDGFIDVLEWSAGRDDATAVARSQQRLNDQRDVQNQQRNGSTTRGAN